MTINENDIFPDITFYQITESGPEGIKANKIFKSKKELDNLCGRDQINHQGIVGEVLELDNNSLKTDLEFLNKFRNIKDLIQYFDDFDEKLSKKTLNSYLKSVSNP